MLIMKMLFFFPRQYCKLVCINGMISESWVVTLMNYNYLRPHLQIFITQHVASLAHYMSVSRIWCWLHSHTHPRICKRTHDAPWEGGAAVLGITRAPSSGECAWWCVASIQYILLMPERLSKLVTGDRRTAPLSYHHNLVRFRQGN